MTAMILSFDIDDICDGTSEIGDNDNLLVRSLLPADLPAVGEMTARCSRDTIFHRFHGFIDLPTYLGGLLTGEQTSVVACWENCCVGLASLGPGAQGPELAVLVEDAWQRRGIGGALFDALVDMAKARGHRLLHADVLFEDAYILRALARYGRLDVELEYGDYSVSVYL